MVGSYGFSREGTTVSVDSDSSSLVDLFGVNVFFTVANYSDLQIGLQVIGGEGGKSTLVVLVSGASKTA